MFTIDQIKDAHSKVRSGADFPAYIREIKQLGVRSYTTYVADGHTDFEGTDGYRVSSPPKYHEQTVADISDAGRFTARLKAHQQGESDYNTFCSESAVLGVERWVVDTGAMTCTYFDRAGAQMVIEDIPDA